MGGGELGPALVPPGHQILELAVLVLSALGPGPRRRERAGQSACLLLGGGQPALRGTDLAAQLGHPLSALGRGAGIGRLPPFGLRQGCLGGGAVSDRGGQLLASGGQPRR